jgi:hypothetical protein
VTEDCVGISCWQGVGPDLGIQFAQKSGKEARDEIVGAVRQGVNVVVAQANKLAHRTEKTFEDTKQHVKKAAEAGGQAYREAKTTSA